MSVPTKFAAPSQESASRSRSVHDVRASRSRAAALDLALRRDAAPAVGAEDSPDGPDLSGSSGSDSSPPASPSRPELDATPSIWDAQDHGGAHAPPPSMYGLWCVCDANDMPPAPWLDGDIFGAGKRPVQQEVEVDGCVRMVFVD